ncbi:helix-turn-helix transcriptional regulator [Bradyrhizobium sp. NP1]|uniref:helix-turn-helix transcriptional regulator n=1 Tax=Bradyrhizobium sp. NP1 TaxID=3049772 RepID=UPI0025A5517C|nr:helix-turn-helix transcriptional regulator [Bradyrhizobium sp. NP1]WJR75529.1 helix-turn-helix transcriptional regulator [Bradyrhizobium sp. NP1]
MPTAKLVPEDVHGRVGARIKSIRQALGLSQAALADRLEVSRPTVSNIENGKARILLSDCKDYAEALGTTPTNLLKGIWR